MTSHPAPAETQPADGELERMLAELQAEIDDQRRRYMSLRFPVDRLDAVLAAIRARLKEDEERINLLERELGRAPDPELEALAGRPISVLEAATDSRLRTFDPKPPALHPKEGG